MVRGPKRHLKRLHAPKSWMLTKLGGTWAPRPSTGPHKLRECMPLIVLLRNRLKYALTRREVLSIVMQRLIQVDGKVRTDTNFPLGFQDVISIERTGEHFRIMYDTKGRFAIHRIEPAEAKYKLCRVKHQKLGSKGVPFIVTHDGRTIRYPNPDIRVNDVVQLEIETGKILDFASFEAGQVAMVTGGRNIGRVGVITKREKHPGSYEIVHMKDTRGQQWATRVGNVFVIGQGSKPWVSLPKGNGIKLSIAEDFARQHPTKTLA